MKTGDIVKYAKPADETEEALRLVVIEDRDSRVLVRWTTPLSAGGLFPTECYAKTEYVLA